MHFRKTIIKFLIRFYFMILDVALQKAKEAKMSYLEK